MKKVKFILRIFFVLRFSLRNREVLSSIDKELFNQGGDLSDEAVRILSIYALIYKFLFEEPIEELNKDINEVKKILKA